ncbi:hypothetical protein MRX96_034771 [Rhipicephalus microplus]
MDEPRRSAAACSSKTTLSQRKQPSEQCLLRLNEELKDIIDNPVPGVFIEPEKGDITYIHAVIVGPENTPYQGGFFHFVVKCPLRLPSLSAAGTLYDDRRRKGALQPEAVQQWARLTQHSGHVSRTLVEPGDDPEDGAAFDPVVAHRAAVGQRTGTGTGVRNLA